MPNETHRKLSAGAVIVRKDQEQWRFLMLRAYRNWDFPKGMVRPAEDALSAALREINEETGLSQLIFHANQNYIETPPYNRGKIARYYLAETNQTEIVFSVNPEIGRKEHHEFRWMTESEAQHNLTPRLLPVMTWAQQHLGRLGNNDNGY